MNEIVLTESRTARAEAAGHVEVLDKVKALSLLPGGTHLSSELVAGYYEVPADSIGSVVRRHRDELTENGLRVLRGDELRDFKVSSDVQDEHHWDRTSTLIVFTRRTVLNVGMLLVDSEVARAIRRALLDHYAAPGPAGPDCAAAESRIRVLGAAVREGVVTRSEARRRARGLLAAAGIGDTRRPVEDERFDVALRWVRTRHSQGETFSLREMHRGLDGRWWAHSVADVEDALARLAEAGHVRPLPRPAPRPVGRPPSQRFEVLVAPTRLALVLGAGTAGGAA